MIYARGSAIWLVVCLSLLVLCGSAKLVQLFSLTRHGARYPINTLYDGADLREWWGQLTAVGMRQHYNLGTYLRKLYIEDEQFVSPRFNHSQLEAYTTYYNRTIDSMIAFASGLYPLGTGTELPTGLETELLVPPYHYKDDFTQNRFALPFGKDFLQHRENTQVFIGCDPQIDQNLITQHATIDEMNSRYDPLIASVRQQLNISQPLNVVNMSSAFDTVLADQFLNRTQPIQDSDLQNMRHLHYFSNLLKMARNYSKSMNTPKLKWMFAAFDKRISAPNSSLKWTLLGGHDTDIYPLLIDLNISSSSCIEELYRFGKTNALNCEPGPQFASSFIVQLYSDDAGGQYVKVRYNGKYVFLCQRKSDQCAYAEFKSRLQKNYVDYATLCRKIP